MFSIKNIYSEDYAQHLRYRDEIRGFVLQAREKVKGATLFGRPVDINNPEDVIACLFLMNKDMGLYHEPR